MGDVVIGGAKNAALGILAAAIMADEFVTVTNLPDVKDVNMQSLMTALLKDTNLDFEISNRQIVLLSKRSSGSKTAKRHISGVVKDEKVLSVPAW